MTKSLFAELKQLGVDEEIASKVSASLDPDYNASKKDILVMQEAIMQVQVRSDARYHEINHKVDQNYHKLNSKIDQVNHDLNHKIDQVNHDLDTKIESVKSEMHQGFAGLRTEMASMNRQYLITFGGLICTIVTVFLVNLYFHF